MKRDPGRKGEDAEGTFCGIHIRLTRECGSAAAFTPVGGSRCARRDVCEPGNTTLRLPTALDLETGHPQALLPRGPTRVSPVTLTLLAVSWMNHVPPPWGLAWTVSAIPSTSGCSPEPQGDILRRSLRSGPHQTNPLTTDSQDSANTSPCRTSRRGHSLCLCILNLVSDERLSLARLRLRRGRDCVCL